MTRDDDDLRAALGGVLDAVENASPVEAVEAATRGLQDALGALSASLLIADLSGRALVRLASVVAPEDDEAAAAGGAGATAEDAGSRRDDRERARVEPLDGGPAEQALQTQSVQVLPPTTDGAGRHLGARGWTVLAPVTERGEALGVLELVLPAAPSATAVAEIARTAHLLGYVVVASRRHTDL